MQAVIFDLDETIFGEDNALYEGVADLLTILRRLGIKIGALTSGDHRMLVRLDEAGIRHHFNGIVCSEHVSEPKQPAGIEHLLGTLKTTVHQTVFVSHAHSDIALG